MQNKKENSGQFGFYSTLEEQLNHQHSLFILTHKINWELFEKTFQPLYSDSMGRPAKPIRRMVALLILKHIRNLSDESVVEQWAENNYYQYFSGEKIFAAGAPCAATDLVHFRDRIGEKGIELIFRESIRVNGKDGEEEEAVADTTVQEKNITFPTDAKPHKKIITKCTDIAQKEELEIRQSYKRVVKRLSIDQRFRNHPLNKGKARKADKKIKTIAGRLVRELERTPPPSKLALYASDLGLFYKVLAQKKEDKDKTYSLHEPHVQCISKGKEHKKYEFGSKVSILSTKTTGVIVGALNIEKNVYDGRTLEPALNQYESLTQRTLRHVYADRGYRGQHQLGQTRIHLPNPLPQGTSFYQRTKTQKNFRYRAAIEPRIGHLKQDYRLSRNYYKGIKGDTINVMLAAAAMNFKRMMNIWKKDATTFYTLLFSLFKIPFIPAFIHQNNLQNQKRTF